MTHTPEEIERHNRRINEMAWKDCKDKITQEHTELKEQILKKLNITRPCDIPTVEYALDQKTIPQLKDLLEKMNKSKEVK